MRDHDRTCLGTLQLGRLEESFRTWYESSSCHKVRLSRERIYLIFLIIRYIGAKLNEVLSFRPYVNFDLSRHIIRFSSGYKEEKKTSRKMRISEILSDTIVALLSDPLFRQNLQHLFW